MKKHAKKLLALTLSLALVLGLVGTASATIGDQTKKLAYRNISVTLNGAKLDLKDAAGKAVEPFIIDGTTYVPVRAIAEALGLNVEWDGENHVVKLNDDTKSGLVPGLVELTAFGNHAKKPASRYPQGQKFNAGYTAENAPTYTNPFVFDYNYSQEAGKTMGVVDTNPFMIGNMISQGMTGENAANVESFNHTQNHDMFLGTGTYIQENASRSAADPHGIYYNGKWYVYASNFYQLVSEDFVTWESIKPLTTDGKPLSIMAPSVDYTVDAKGVATFYLAGNNTHLYRSVGSPTGPWEDLGDFTYNGLAFGNESLKYNEDGTKAGDGPFASWTGGTYGDDKAASPYDSKDANVIADHNDVNIFVDRENGNRMYLCWGMGSKYLYIAELDPANPTKLKSAPVEVITFNRESGWEGFGQYNQDYETGFAEGSMLFKYNGVYYWTFATGGTQYDGYTFGVYTNKTNDLLNKDNWVYQEQEVINPDGDDAQWGSVRGGGHGSIVVGPNGQLWCFYTVNIGYEGDMERRLGADPAYIDANGNLTVPHLSEKPQYVPGVLANPCGEAGNETGADILTARQGYGVSSYAEGRHPMYAIDESPVTWWQPALTDAQPWYIVSLKGQYDVAGIRVMLKDVETNRSNTYAATDPTYSYKIEVYNGTENPVLAGTSDKDSNAGWVTVATMKDAGILEYIDLDGIRAQFVRITFTDWTGKIS